MAKKPEKLVDERCYELAEHFLAEEPHRTEEEKMSLAADIQRAVEDWDGWGESR